MQKQLETILNNELDPAFAKRARIILEKVETKKPHTILDAGCGRGFYVHAFSLFPTLKEIHGVDINETYLKKAQQHIKDSRVRLKKGSIYSLPYPDNYFDFIVSSEVLEHLDNDKKALIELKRVLKPKGTLMITVPNYRFPFLWDPLNWLLMKLFNTHVNKNIWWLAGIWADHERLYKIEDLTNLVKRANFSLVKAQTVVSHAWPFSHFLLYGIGKNIVERLGVTQFNRFDFTPKPFTQMLAQIIAFPNKLDKDTSTKSVNIVMELQKE